MPPLKMRDAIPNGRIEMWASTAQNRVVILQLHLVGYLRTARLSREGRAVRVWCQPPACRTCDAIRVSTGGPTFDPSRGVQQCASSTPVLLQASGASVAVTTSQPSRIWPSTSPVEANAYRFYCQSRRQRNEQERRTSEQDTSPPHDSGSGAMVCTPVESSAPARGKGSRLHSADTASLKPGSP